VTANPDPSSLDDPFDIVVPPPVSWWPPAPGQQVDRLTAVKQVLDDFLARRKGDRVGLIFFGSAAFLQAPFTEDLDALRSLLDEAQVRMAGPKTEFGDAIGLALDVFAHDEGVRDRVLIVLTCEWPGRRSPAPNPDDISF
jgi:Mg-chelatase subunit ChlD